MTSYSEQMLDDLDRGQLDAAKKSFASALRHDDDETLHSLAEELFALGFTKNAKRTLLKLLERYPKEDLFRTELAEIAIADDDTEAALNYLSVIEPTSNAYLEALLVQADLYQSEGLNEVAENKLQVAEAMAPDEPVIHFALAELWFSASRYSEAIPEYRSLIAAGTTSWSGVNLVSRIGVAYAMLGDNRKALGYLEQIPVTELTTDVKFQLAMLYAMDDEQTDQAIRLFEELLDEDQAYAGAYVPLAQLYEQKADPKQALVTYEAGLAVDQFNEKSYLNAARVAQQLGEIDQADQLYQKALKNLPDNPDIINAYASFLVYNQQMIEAVNLLNKALEDDDYELDAFGYWNLAQAYTDLEDYAMADQYWQAAFPLLQTTPDFLKQSYAYYREAGNRPMMQKSLAAYLQAEPDDTEMAYEYELLKDDLED
ncbi:tetratricopeptide repeat protein [Weissella kandleri]|uniref:tetratricopeptide repeat protein n=1 Tax=Weissella kandleri TaxID=1616 RepID=UPI00387E51C2